MNDQPYFNPQTSISSPNPPSLNVSQPTSSSPVLMKNNLKDHSGLIKTICLIFTSLVAVSFIGLFIYMYIQWNNTNVDIEGRINLAVAKAENALKTKLEGEFAEKEKYPFRTFSGPTDFGSLNFEYPKTWNIYISDDASKAENYHAYLNPGQVNVVADKTVMSLRVSIINSLTDQVKSDYNDKVKDGKMTVSTTVVNGANVDIYTGTLDSDMKGIVCILKIRDKTAILQTDAMIFKDDFYRILKTVKFNA